MAIFNEILAGRFNRGLQKFFSMKGRAVTPQLSGEVVPVLPFFWGLEARYLESWNRFGSFTNTAAVAAQNSVGRIHNPTGSGVIVVLEKLAFTHGIQGTVNLEYGANVDLATPSTIIGFDLRGGPQLGGSVCVVSSANNVGTFNTFAIPNIGANQQFDWILFDEQELLINPGNSISVRNSTVNDFLQVNFVWRERALEESEKF